MQDELSLENFCFFIQLLNSIKCVELQREDQQQDFWLLQYQKLLDSQPKALVLKSSNIDPLLGHQLLISGVIHYIPLLADVLKQCNDDYAKISDVDLTKVGIKNTADRIAILQAIKHYYEQQSRHSVNSESSVVSRSANETSTSSSQASEMKQFEENSPNSMNECVICMEKTVRHLQIVHIILFQFYLFVLYSRATPFSFHAAISAVASTVRIP